MSWNIRFGGGYTKKSLNQRFPLEEKNRKIKLIDSAIECGQSVASASRTFGIDHKTYCMWKKEQEVKVLT